MKIYQPQEFNKFPFDNDKIHWHLMRADEFHMGNIFKEMVDGKEIPIPKETFILHGIDAEGHEENAVYILPETIHFIIEFARGRGRLERGKEVSLMIKELLSFERADVITGHKRD